MSKVLDPSKELRFNRSAQAILFAVLVSFFLAIAVTCSLIVYTVKSSDLVNKELPFPLWVLILAWVLVIPFVFLCYHCVKHPYLILSPIGVEIFPFWRPVKNFNLVEWARVADVDIAKRAMTLHYDKEHTGGVVLSLSPLSQQSRQLLSEAISGVMTKRK